MVRALPLLLLTALLLPTHALAESLGLHREEPVEPRTYVHLRGGPSNLPVRPEVCGEIAPLRWLSLEACGTGAGLWHSDGGELVHFRAGVKVAGAPVGGGWAAARATAGFSELQLTGDDDAGFYFTGTGPRGIETAGPEAGAGVRWLRGIGGGFEFIADLHGSLSWLPHAPRLVQPRSAWQPAASLTFGVGF
jgi:hypothetical protein